MRIKFLRNINRVLVIGVMLSISVSSFGESHENFPFHVGKTIEKEITYGYAFEDVWNVIFEVLKNIDDVTKRVMEERGLKSFKSNIKSDRDSGLITYTTTHKGERGLFTAGVLPTFKYKVFLVEPLEKRRTRMYFHEISYISYDGNVFNDNAFARRLDFVAPEEKILEEIKNRLREKSYENQ